MVRTPDEVKEIVCNIVRFYSENRPSDSVTPVISITAVSKYKGRAEALLEKLRKHNEAIPEIIVRGTKIKQITAQIATKGRQIRQRMEELAEEFLTNECARV